MDVKQAFEVLREQLEQAHRPEERIIGQAILVIAESLVESISKLANNKPV